MEYVAREHRQQCVDAAEDDGEQVERDGAENDRIVPDIGEAGEQHGEADRLARGRVALDLHVADQNARCEVERAAQRIDQDWADRVKQSARGRSADHRDLRGGCAGGRGARQQRQRHDPRQQRRQRGLLEGARRTRHEHDSQQRFARQPAAPGADRQRGGGECRYGLADADNQPPVVAVGDMAGDQHEQGGRDELNEADQSEIERIVRQVIHLPGHRHRLHLQGDGAEHPRQPIECERPVMPKRRVGRFCGAHRNCLAFIERLYMATNSKCGRAINRGRAEPGELLLDCRALRCEVGTPFMLSFSTDLIRTPVRWLLMDAGLGRAG